MSEQARLMVQTWESSLGRFYPQYLKDWVDPNSHLKAIKEQWNHLPASECVDWDAYLTGEDLKILDLGAGPGWLSIQLSKRENVSVVYALDSSRHNLEEMLPPLTELMGGNRDKIIPIHALFTPILVGDAFFDAVVASSAIHHSPDLEVCLREVFRVLKPSGWFLILNEQPFSYPRYSVMLALRCVSLMSRVISRKWISYPKWVSESGIVVDPYLGDRSYAEWQWKHALENSGFSFSTIVTPYFPYRDKSDRRNKIRLTHFVAQKTAVE